MFTLFTSCASKTSINQTKIKENQPKNYFTGLVVYDVESDRELININGEKYFTPASNTKLFTFYTAYKVLGDSILGLEYTNQNDSLIIKGTADPSLLYNLESRKTIHFLAQSANNIYLVNKQIDDYKYGDGWSWDDYAYGYMPEKSLFPIYGNVATVSYLPKTKQITPKLFSEKLEVLDNGLRRAFDQNKFYVKPTQTIKERHIPFRTSNQLVADLLSQELGKKVILIDEHNDYDYKPFYSVASDSLYQILLQDSDNFIAEQLMLQVANKTNHGYHVKKAIKYSIEHFFEELNTKPRWVDGSGLSRYNLFTPESMVFVLKQMYQDIDREKLFELLPAGGVNGTLKNHYQASKPYVFAKSGTLSNNYNLSGYLLTKRGKVLIFSYMNNHFKQPLSKIKADVEAQLLKLHHQY